MIVIIIIYFYFQVWSSIQFICLSYFCFWDMFQIITGIIPNLLVFYSIFVLSWDAPNSYGLSRPQTWTYHLLINVSSFPILLSSLCYVSHNFSLSYLGIFKETLLASIVCHHTLIHLLLHSPMCLLPLSFFLSKSSIINTGSFVNLFFNSLNASFCFSVQSYLWFFLTRLCNSLVIAAKSLINHQ